LKDNSGSGKDDQLSNYTSNWSGTMELFLNLIDLKQGDTVNYQKSFDILLNWMKNYPLKTNKWGPFFEDVPGWSDTQINAVTFAQFMMNHPEYFPEWKTDVIGVFTWIYKTLGNMAWKKYKVIVVNEQTAYKVPGNSHTSRQASVELQYAVLSKEQAGVKNAIRQLNWATYMVDDDGKNCYPNDEVWMTDGYGDYVRHYLRAMAFYPELAPSDQTHLLTSSSVVQLMEYPPAINKFLGGNVPFEKAQNAIVHYRTFDSKSTETIRMSNKPDSVTVNNVTVSENDSITNEGWNWIPFEKGGLLTVRHITGNEITVFGK
jgi:hypothetical protein